VEEIFNFSENVWELENEHFGRMFLNFYGHECLRVQLDRNVLYFDYQTVNYLRFQSKPSVVFKSRRRSTHRVLILKVLNKTDGKVAKLESSCYSTSITCYKIKITPSFIFQASPS